MRPAAAAAAALFATLTVATPLDTVLSTRQTQPAVVQFVIYNFTAVCIVQTSQCLYDFDLWDADNAGENPPGTHCQKLATTDPTTTTTPGLLPAVTDGTCSSTSETWSVVRATGGLLNITASVPVSHASSKTGSHLVQAEELRMYSDSTNSRQRYVGPRDFSLFYANSGGGTK